MTGYDLSQLIMTSVVLAIWLPVIVWLLSRSGGAPPEH